MEGKGGRVFRNLYKGHGQNQGGVRSGVGGGHGLGGVLELKWRQLYLNNNKKKSGLGS